MFVFDFKNSTAYEIALWLNEALELQVPIDDKVKNSCYFEFSFDGNKGAVHCSNLLPVQIARHELENPKASESYKRVLDIAKRAVSDYRNTNLDDPSLYAVFSCLHEFGHYEQWQSLGASEFEKLQRKRASSFSSLNNRAQLMADKGLGPECVYHFFASGYRELPLEKEADAFSVKYLMRLFGVKGDQLR